MIEVLKENNWKDIMSSVQTVVQAVITALLLWIGSSLIDVRDRLIRLEVLSQTGQTVMAAEIIRLKERIDVLERKNANRC